MPQALQQTTAPTNACRCGHGQRSHYRERSVCIKISCDCSAYDQPEMHRRLANARSLGA